MILHSVAIITLFFFAVVLPFFLTAFLDEKKELTFEEEEDRKRISDAGTDTFFMKR